MSDVALAGDLVRTWSPRKAGLFGQAHVQACWNRLSEYGWLRPGIDEIGDANLQIDAMR